MKVFGFRFAALLTCGSLLPLTACLFPTGPQRNSFLTLAETLGVALTPTDPDDDDPSGEDLIDEFRQPMTVNFANMNQDADLKFAYAAWVNVSSIRTAEQQDALLRDGYVQLTSAVQLGTVFTLPPGTFVRSGPGIAGATTEFISAGGSDDVTLVTPDVFLVFLDPPTSCDSVAFLYSEGGEVVEDEVTGDSFGTFGGATGFGGRKTLAQIDAYQCSPLRPGMFLKVAGGPREPNEFLEGENLTFSFFAGPQDANGNYAIVDIED